MRYYIISGEASGDLHGSNLMKELSVQDRSAEFRVWGGDLMKQQGGDLAKHYRDLAFMGFVEVVQNLGTILKNISFCKKDIIEYKPDVVILIDYPGFNLRIARHAKLAGFKVYYYISPTLWAWRESRIKKIKRFVDKMFVILPFEKEFYKGLGYDADFVGHPLLDSISDKDSDSVQFRSEFCRSSEKIITLLPGSRKQEIKRILPIMLCLVSSYPDYQFVIGGAPGIDKDYYSGFIKGMIVPVVFNRIHELMDVSEAAIVTSGTATLEAALFKVPEVVCYRGGAISFFIAKIVVNVDFISLPNLIMEERIVKELIQKSMTVENIKEELDEILLNKKYRSEMLANFDLLSKKLGGKGASQKLAKIIVDSL